MHEVAERIHRYILDNRQGFVKDLKALLAQPSVSTTGEGMDGAAGLVVEMLEGAGLRAELLKADNGYPAIFGELREERHGTLMFYNHYDVQPVDPVDKWRSPPFSPEERDGRIYARGACDNKGNLMARLKAVETLLATLGEVPLNVKFLIEGEEEIGSPSLPLIIERNKEMLDADACIWETGTIDKYGSPIIYLGVKGLLYLELISRGAKTDLHSSWGTVVDNPAWRLVNALATMRNERGYVTIEGFYDDVGELSPSVERLLERIELEEGALLETFGIRDFLNGRRGRELLKEWLLAPTLNICGLNSGYVGEGSKTVIPSVAMAKIDFRLVPNMDPQRVLELLKGHLNKFGYGDIEIRVLQGYPAARIDPDEPLVEIVSRTARVAFGAEPKIYPSMAGSGPMYLVTDILGQPCVSTGICGFDSNIHAPNENLVVENFLRGIEHMCLLMINFVPWIRWGEAPYL